MTNEDIVGLIKGTEKVKFILPGLGESELTTFELKFLVDAYEFQQSVVRCGDCKDSDSAGLYCYVWSNYTREDGYCYLGRRRDADGGYRRQRASFSWEG